MYKCNCVSNSNTSYIAKDLPVTLNPNDYFNWDVNAKLVVVDFCIKDQILKLWENNIWTVNSCCGHNGLYEKAVRLYGYGPTVIIDEHSNADLAVKILKEIDKKRNWIVMQWQLININKN